MRERKRRGFTSAEKTELWDRWQRGESLNGIGRAFGKPSSSIHAHVSLGIRSCPCMPWPRAMVATPSRRPAAARPANKVFALYILRSLFERRRGIRRVLGEVMPQIRANRVDLGQSPPREGAPSVP